MNYVHFIVYMKNKNINDCTSQETLTYLSIMKKEIEWFPRQMCLSIKNLNDNNIASEVDHKEISMVYSNFKGKIAEILENDQLLFNDGDAAIDDENLDDDGLQ